MRAIAADNAGSDRKRRIEPAPVVWVYLKQNTAYMAEVQLARFNFVVFGLSNKKRVEVRMNAQNT